MLPTGDPHFGRFGTVDLAVFTAFAFARVAVDCTVTRGVASAMVSVDEGLAACCGVFDDLRDAGVALAAVDLREVAAGWALPEDFAELDGLLGPLFEAASFC